jgi:hypothetical protein
MPGSRWPSVAAASAGNLYTNFVGGNFRRHPAYGLEMLFQGWLGHSEMLL